MAKQSVGDSEGRLSALLIDPLGQSEAMQLKQLASRELGGLSEEMIALADVLFLASTHSESQLALDTVAYVASLQRRLVRLQGALCSIAT